MKKMKSLLLLTAMLLSAMTGLSQSPVSATDTMPDFPFWHLDANIYGVPFYTVERGIVKFHVGAKDVYASTFNSIGASVNIHPDSALAMVKASFSNPLKRVWGYNTAVCWNPRRGGYDLTIANKPDWFDARFICRIDRNWSLYGRDGCGNLVFVYEPLPEEKEDELVDKKGEEEFAPTSLQPRDVNLNMVVQVNIQQKDCGCKTEFESWGIAYLVGGYSTLYNPKIAPESPYLGIGYRRHWRKKSSVGSTFGGVELLGMVRGKLLDCPEGGCLDFFQDTFPTRASLRLWIYGGREFGIPGLTRLRLFGQLGYAVVNPKSPIYPEDNVFLPEEEGLKVTAGLRYDLGGIEIQPSVEYDVFSGEKGGDVRIVVSTAAIKVLAEKQRAREQEKALRKLQEQMIANSIALDSLLRQYPERLKVPQLGSEVVDEFNSLRKVLNPRQLEKAEKLLEQKIDFNNVVYNHNYLRSRFLSGDSSVTYALVKSFQQIETAKLALEKEQAKLDRVVERAQRKIDKSKE